jgi:hypothetical protein
MLRFFFAHYSAKPSHVGRAGFYRHYEEHESRQTDVALRDLIFTNRPQYALGNERWQLPVSEW